MPIHYVIGDATLPKGLGPKVVCHCVNDIGQWGSGFVLSVNDRWPKVEGFYREWYRLGESPVERGLQGDSSETTAFGLGHVQFVEVEHEIWVANLVGQHSHIREGEKVPVRYEAIATGMEAIHKFCTVKAATAHMPRLGAGLAKGNWGRISRIITFNLADKGIPTTVYDLTV